MSMQSLTWPAAVPAEAHRWTARAPRLNRFTLWSMALAIFFMGTCLLTWNRWTVAAFPHDAGREMIVPRLILEGRELYTQIRCFYGPMGYWLNALLIRPFGATEESFWLVNLLRFCTLIALLWLLAWRMLPPMLAALALAGGVFSLFYSFAVPYSASVGWGAWLLTAGMVCGAMQLTARGAPAGAALTRQRAGGRPLGWSIAAAVLLSLAASCKHEYALAAAAVLGILMMDRLWRGDSPAQGRAALLAMAAAFVVPLAALAVFLLAKVPWAVLIHQNLWVSALLNYHLEKGNYASRSILSAYELISLVELLGLLAAAAALAGFLALRQSGKRMPPAAKRAASRKLYLPLIIGIGAAVGAELCLGRPGIGRGPEFFAYPKWRPRELIELLPLLCLPLSLLVLAVLARRGRREEFRRVWQKLGGPGRAGFLGLLVYLIFATREVNGAIAVTRQPFTMLLLVWLLARFIPRTLRWPGLVRRVWVIGVTLLIYAMTACAVDAIVLYQAQPATFLSGKHESMYAWQRHKPFTPRWFQAAMQTLHKHRARLAGRTIACVPEGAWAHVLLGLDWPTRDTQWMPFCQDWIIEDLTGSPPAFLLVMEPSRLAELGRVLELTNRDYVPIETNAAGMTLYEYRDPKQPRPAVVACGS